ncbi:CRAL-TRIO domain-containing protein [Bisporella sp. PMI_857]|nr:CRAL-TRIO domain-containing protein [Bisporella sp. PMI_857]
MSATLTAEDPMIEKIKDIDLDSNKDQSSPKAPSLRPLKTPLLTPSESSIPPPAREVSPEQQAKYDTVLKTVKTWKEVPAKDGLGGAITEDEIMWLTKECIFRYLRATKWVTGEAEKRLLGTLTWRREFGVAGLTGDHISPENETGKQLILGYDIAARPCHYLNPGRQNTDPSHRQVEHLVFMLERVIEIGVPGQETLALLINFKSSKSRSNTAPGIGMAREVLNILQTHYPERLGRALIINIPWIVSGFFKLITPFIDPLTREKLKFNGDMRQHVPPQQLWTEFQGDLEFDYDHETYWPALLKICEEKRAKAKERWMKGGKQYGESEFYIKGGDLLSIGGGQVEAMNGDAKPAEASQPALENGHKATEAEIPVQVTGNQPSEKQEVAAIMPPAALTREGDRP